MATGLVVDLAACHTGAQQYLADAGVADRARFVAADLFLDALPSAELYLLKNVIHDWDDEHALALIRRVRQHMAPGARLLIIETIVADPIDDTPASRRTLWADLRMLIATGGRERTALEYAALLEEAGLHLAAVIPTPASTDLIEATRADERT